MSIDEQDLRTAFREIADATPIPDRWEVIVAGSNRARRNRTIVTTGSAVLALAAAIAVAVVVVGAHTTNRFAVRAGAAHRDAVSVFSNGPTVALGNLSDGRLAFVSDSHLFVVDAGGKTARQLTTKGDASALSWSADGQWLAFSVRNAPGYEDYTTWITRADGTGARALDGMGDTFAWSPTGHQLAVAGFCCTSSERGGVFIVDPGHDPQQIVAQGSQILTIAWAPDGRTVGYTESAIYPGPGATPAVWTVGADGTGLKQVGLGDLVAWSPDGNSMLVQDNTRIRLLPVGGTGRASLLGTSVALVARDPSTWSAFSADGHVAVVEDSGTGVHVADVVTVCQPGGVSCTVVATAKSEQISGPSFSPDGRELTYVSDHALWVVAVPANPGGQIVAPRKLEDLGRDLLQGAGDGVHITRGTAPNVPVWLSDGTILYRHGAELRIIDPTTGVSQRIASPIGFSNSGPSDQGLPGGTPVAASNLTSRGVQP